MNQLGGTWLPQSEAWAVLSDSPHHVEVSPAWYGTMTRIWVLHDGKWLLLGRCDLEGSVSFLERFDQNPLAAYRNRMKHGAVVTDDRIYVIDAGKNEH